MGKERDARRGDAEVKARPVAGDSAESAPPSLTRELERVEEANLGFYEAFSARDLDQMSSVWSRSPHVRCVHPGWDLVVGWTEIRQSWAEIFRTIHEIDFGLEDIHIEVAGRIAWCNLVANVDVTTDDGEHFEARVVTTNIFEDIDGKWALVLHHSSNFSDEEAEEEDDLDMESGSGDMSGEPN